MLIDEHKAMKVIWSLREIEYHLARKRHAQQGYIYPESGHYYVRFYRDVIINGEVRRKRDRAPLGIAEGKGKITLTEARQKARDLLAEIDSPNARPTALIKFRDYYFGAYQSRLKATSKQNQRSAESMFRLHILPELGGLQLRDITRTNIQDLINLKANQPALGWQTVEHIRKFIAAIFNHAHQDKVISGDLPTDHLKMPSRAQRNPIPSLGFEQANFVLGRLRQPYLSMAALSMCSSPNVAEMCGIKWKRINLTNDTILVDARAIPQHAVWIAEDYSLGEFRATKTSYRDRLIPIPDVLIPLLEEWRRLTRFSGPDDVVFASSRGTPVSYNNANKRIFKPLGHAIQLDFSWNSFRHTFATRSEDIGIRQIDKKALMGHSKRADMTDGYTEEVWPRMRAVVNALAEKFGIESLLQERKEKTECLKVVSIR